jgi:hypothetical protein
MKHFKVPTNIKKRNAWFNTLSPNQQRITIASDVLNQLATSKFIAEHRTYFSLEDGDSTDNCTLQQKIDTNGCRVCAMGAVFASRVRVANEIEDSYVEADDIIEALDNIFDEEQLRLMEVAFEGEDIASYFNENYSTYDEEMGEWVVDCDDYHSALDMYDSYDTAHDRLKAVMTNVVTNMGVFRP